ncbi:ester cyclase [Streptomyces hoynatensis]|uniref:Nuclear transport factor 2 family protein n=1 Tax=Streptomyces hoynatensis TaxID=1141874 RepID=A0A3A9ZEW3_9ACTN|nr:nuclear transport factor 2 family protein [Streptomyces hoynatensis]RKN45826.1 nuclear transport factor 2 family protein [Streptomyces hoynatensis]
MGEEELKARYVRWIDELWNGPADPERLAAVAGTLVTGDFVGHWPGRVVEGPDGIAALIAETKGMFSALSFEIEVPPFAEGEFVAARWTGRGLSATGATRFFGNDILRARDGRFAEYWVASATV